MATAYIQGSFRATADARIRLTRTDTADTVDWTVDKGDTWNSADDLLSEWTGVIQADGNFGSAFSITAPADTANLYCVTTVTTGGPSWTITWSVTGDGTDLRDWLGGSGATESGGDAGTLTSWIPASYVAAYGAIDLARSETRGGRGHFVATDGSQETQHSWDPAEEGEASLDFVLLTGKATGSLTYAQHERLEGFLDNLWSQNGGGEPFSLFHQDDSQSTPDQWVLRFAGDRLSFIPERVEGAEMGRLYRLAWPSCIVVSAPW